MMCPPLALDVDLSCANCGEKVTIALSLEDARRCGFGDPNEDLRQDMP